MLKATYPWEMYTMAMRLVVRTMPLDQKPMKSVNNKVRLDIVILGTASNYILSCGAFDVFSVD